MSGGALALLALVTVLAVLAFDVLVFIPWVVTGRWPWSKR